MAKTTAPALSLAQLIDMRLDICRQIEALEKSKTALGDKITEQMKAEGLKEAYGTQGDGYQLIEFIKADYSDKALAYAIKEKIDGLFRAEPKITRSKVFEALKRSKITTAQFTELQKFAGPEYPVFILKTIKEDERV